MRIKKILNEEAKEKLQKAVVIILIGLMFFTPIYLLNATKVSEIIIGIVLSFLCLLIAMYFAILDDETIKK